MLWAKSRRPRYRLDVVPGPCHQTVLWELVSGWDVAAGGVVDQGEGQRRAGYVAVAVPLRVCAMTDRPAATLSAHRADS
jgi:hypothetical protein